MNIHVKDFKELIRRELNCPECDNFHGTQLVLMARDADVSGGKIRRLSSTLSRHMAHNYAI